ncbi:MAG: hypothetical protein ABGX63_00040 [bacterium]
MASTTLPERVIDAEPANIQVLKHLFKELEDIIEATEAGPELVHWDHFVPCAGVKYHAYHTYPSPVEPLVRRKT